MLQGVIVTRAVISLVVLCVLIAGCGSNHAGGSSDSLVAIGAGLHAPKGLGAGVFARGVPHVAALARGPSGGIWAAAAGLTDHRADGVYVIPPGGGRARRAISGLRDPLGLLWLRGRLYVSSLGKVSVFSGFNGTRFTRASTVVRGPVRHGENNGLALAPDGDLVMGITATCDHCLSRSRFSGAIVSFRTDGKDLRVYAAGIRAPVGLTYVPRSDDLLVSMNQRDDLGAKTTGDALALVRSGSNWRFPGCYQQGGGACVGVPPVITLLDKHAAVGPVVVVDGARLGTAAPLAALVSEWQVGRVMEVSLRRVGGGYGGSARVWLTGARNPLALMLYGSDSLLVGDWASGLVYRVRGPA